jgi:hypothetical protein
MADGRWQMADGRWQMADGRWQMADGGWRMVEDRGSFLRGRRGPEGYPRRRLTVFVETVFVFV